MMFDIDTLYEAKIENLERLAKSISVPLPVKDVDDRKYKIDLCYAILRKEKRITKGLKGGWA